jgi:DNA-binding MarR family transcriptional regulator
MDLDSPELAAAIADGRFFIRKAYRIFDEEAKALGLHPLENQLMVQLRGVPDFTRSIGELAERLDVPSTLMSRVVTQLEERALVKRKTSAIDKRTVLVEATKKGYVLTRSVAERAIPRLEEFITKYDKRRRRAALAVWAHNFGV